MQFKPTERALLVDLLIFGPNRAKPIAERTNIHRNTIAKYTNELQQSNHLLAKGGGVYRLSDKGRQAAEGLVLSGELPYGTTDSDGDD